MKDIQIIFSIISLFAGAAAISIAFFINHSNKKKAFTFFIGLNLALFVIQNGIVLNLYSDRISEKNVFILIAANIFDILGTAFSSLFGLFLAYYLLGKPVSGVKKVIFLAVPAFQLSGIGVCQLVNLTILENIVRISIFAVIAYEAFFVLLNYRKISNYELKKAIRIFVIITLIFLPVLILEGFREHIKWLSDFSMLKSLALPSFFLTVNVCSLIFSVTYFNSPAFIENNKLTKYFINKFGITEKESEVIELLVAGNTYRQVAESLFIANKTVDNHVQNIYKKLGVTSKLQLANLVRSKEN